jgi:hypothetical protein
MGSSVTGNFFKVIPSRNTPSNNFLAIAIVSAFLYGEALSFYSTPNTDYQKCKRRPHLKQAMNEIHL